MNVADPSISASITTAGSGPSTPFPTGSSVGSNLVRFINPANSGAFDFSFDGGNTWHLRPMSGSVNGYAEDYRTNGWIFPQSIQVRRNGATDVAALSVDVIY